MAPHIPVVLKWPLRGEEVQCTRGHVRMWVENMARRQGQTLGNLSTAPNITLFLSSDLGAAFGSKSCFRVGALTANDE